MRTKERLPRSFKMHWGEGQVTEEARCLTQYHEPCIQLMEFDDGAICIRFCYYKKGRFQRGPLMLNVTHLTKLRKALRQSPKLKKLLKKLVA